MGMYWKYFKYIIEHKKNVFVEGRKLGLPIWRLLVHDMSKFSKAEFKPYAHRFFGSANYLKTHDVEEEFKFAWHHHKLNNSHHWGYHRVNGSFEPKGDPNGKFLDYYRKMPYLDAVEMIADWNAMSVKFLAKGSDKFIDPIQYSTHIWWDANKYSINLHVTTKKLVLEYMFTGKILTEYEYNNL